MSNRCLFKMIHCSIRDPCCQVGQFPVISIYSLGLRKLGSLSEQSRTQVFFAICNFLLVIVTLLRIWARSICQELQHTARCSSWVSLFERFDPWPLGLVICHPWCHQELTSYGYQKSPFQMLRDLHSSHRHRHSYGLSVRSIGAVMTRLHEHWKCLHLWLVH